MQASSALADRRGLISHAYAGPSTYHPKLGCPAPPRWPMIRVASVSSRRRVRQPGIDMVAIDRKAHWERIYSSRGEAGVSWYQSEPRLSLELIQSVAPSAGGRIIDVGGGASVLVDRLL